jgi:hypothetical protein
MEKSRGAFGERDYGRAIGSSVGRHDDLRVTLEESVGSGVDRVTLGGCPDLRPGIRESTDLARHTWRKAPELDEGRNSTSIEKPDEEANTRIGAGGRKNGKWRASTMTLHSVQEWT